MGPDLHATYKTARPPCICLSGQSMKLTHCSKAEERLKGYEYMHARFASPGSRSFTKMQSGPPPSARGGPQ